MGVKGTMNRGGGMLTKRQEIVAIMGYFEPNGSSDPTVVKAAGVASVKHSATGKFTITLDDSYYEIVSLGSAEVQGHAVGTAWCQWGDTVAPAQSTQATAVLWTVAATNSSTTTPVAADIANSAGPTGSRVHFQIYAARRSS